MSQQKCIYTAGGTSDRERFSKPCPYACHVKETLQRIFRIQLTTGTQAVHNSCTFHSINHPQQRRWGIYCMWRGGVTAFGLKAHEIHTLGHTGYDSPLLVLSPGYVSQQPAIHTPETVGKNMFKNTVAQLAQLHPTSCQTLRSSLNATKWSR